MSAVVSLTIHTTRHACGTWRGMPWPPDCGTSSSSLTLTDNIIMGLFFGGPFLAMLFCALFVHVDRVSEPGRILFSRDYTWRSVVPRAGSTLVWVCATLVLYHNDPWPLRIVELAICPLIGIFGYLVVRRSEPMRS